MYRYDLLILCSSHSRQETREGQQRPINKDYYYIDFHATIDAIKYRIFHLTNKVKDMYKPSEEKKDYHCLRCHSQWTQLEVLDKINPMTGEFSCHRCDGILERDDVSAADMAGHERQSNLMSQLERLLKLMPLIDSQIIPNNDFETAFSHAVPVQRNEFINPVRKMEPLEPSRGPPTAVKGITQVSAGPLEISLTTSSEKTAAEHAADAKRKADIAAQNALPVWHTNSTVTGETTTLSNRERERLPNGNTLGLLKDEEEEKKGGDILVDELAAYYDQMKQEKEKEAREDREADESSGEDEEDQFEDVGIGASDIATPSSSISTNANGGKTLSSVNGVKLQDSESGSSAPGTGISTPIVSGTAVEGFGGSSPAKRLKLEESFNGAGLVQPRGEVLEKDSDEDEEAEFEDAL